MSLSFDMKRSMKNGSPFYYSSQTMHFMNTEITLPRKCVPSPINLNLLSQDAKSFAESVELDLLCSKPLDKVPRNILFHKLCNFRFEDFNLTPTPYLTNQRQNVVINISILTRLMLLAVFCKALSSAPCSFSYFLRTYLLCLLIVAPGYLRRT